MNLLGAKLYDPAGAVSKATSSLLAMTAFDTTNLRLAVTVPAHGMVRFKIRCIVTGATTAPTVFLGVLNGATVVGRVVPLYENATANAATQNFALDAEFTATGLTPGATNFDAAYGVEVVVASTNIKYGGPNNTTTNDAWGAFLFEAWDPQPMTLALDGGVNVKQWNGTAVATPATAGIPDVNVKNMNNVSGAAITTIKAVQGLATDGVVPTVTTLTNLPSITAGWLTASGIAASALNGKGDWNIGKTGYALSTAGVQAIWDALTSALTTVGSIGKKLADWVIGTTQTGDAYARLGAPVGASISADIAAVKTQTGAIETDTQDLQARTPAALVSGRMDSSVGAMAANVLTATAINADAITAAKVAADVTTEIQSGLATSASIAALNNVSTAQVQTAAAAALTAYDPPTRTEATADKDEILTAVGDVPTNAELTTALAGADDVTLAAIAALNNVSTAQVQTAAAAALTAYDPPTRTEATADKDEILTSVGDVPTNAELATALASADDATLAAITAATSPLATQTSVNAVKAKTDQLTFTTAGEVDANTHSINNVAVGGAGTEGDPWGPA